MKRTLLLIVLILTGILLSVSALAQGEQAFLKLNGIEGSARDARHEKWIDVISFSMVAEPGSSNTMTFTLDADDRAASVLESYFTKGQRISDGNLEMCASVAGRVTAVNCVEFGNLRVEAVKACTDATTGRAVQEVTIRAESMDWTVSDSAAPLRNNGFFVKIGDLEGASDFTDHEGWINLLSYEETGFEGRADGIFTFLHTVDQTTPKLRELCLNQTMISDGKLDAVEPVGRSEYAANRQEFGRLWIFKTEVRGERTQDGGMRFVDEVTVRYANEKWTIDPRLVDSAANGSYFITLDEIEGNAVDAAHEKWIDVTSFAADCRYEPNPDYQGKTPGTVTFTHAIDSATPALRAAMRAGTKIGGTLDVCKTVEGNRIVANRNDLSGVKVVGTKMMLEEQPNGAFRLMEEVTLQCGDEQWTVVPGAADPAGKDIYLRLLGIEGEAEETRYQKWMDILSYSEKSGNTFVFRHPVDTATPKIVDECGSGHITFEGELCVCKAEAGRLKRVQQILFQEFRVIQSEVRSEVAEDGSPRVVEEFTIECRKDSLWNPPKTKPDPPVTGDSTPIPLYLLLAAAACADMLLLRKTGRKI